MGISIQIDVEKLASTRKLFIATPMFGGKCEGMYCRSMIELTKILTQMTIPYEPYFLFNESLITRARNYCADEFMRSDCTHMLFLDSDIGFNPHDIVAMLALQDNDSKYDIIGAPYPKKTIAWEKIKLAVDKGFADEDPGNLEKYVGDFVFNPKAGVSQIPLGEPVEVLEIGTGFMMIRRKTFDILNAEFPELLYKPDHVRSEHFDGSRKIMMYFQAAIDPRTERYLSEDYWFCQKVQEVGLTTWLCPWMKTNHVGTYIFGGSMIDLAQVGANPTADLDEVNRIKTVRGQPTTTGNSPIALPKRGPRKKKVKK